MHRRKSGPLKQTNCLEREKTKMDSASCKINSKPSHSGRFGILRDEPEDEWERETRIREKHWIRETEVQKGAPPVLPCGLQDVLLELSPYTRIALLTNSLSWCGFPPRVDTKLRIQVQALYWELPGIQVDGELI